MQRESVSSVAPCVVQPEVSPRLLFSHLSHPQALVNEKKTELERLDVQHDSLVRVKAEQKALIDKLTNNEA